jgi:hypothetical protein
MAMASRDSGLPSFCRAIEAAGQSVSAVRRRSNNMGKFP